MIRATIDTNVIISGLLFGGVPLQVLDAGFWKKFIWISSPPLLKELEIVLGRTKFSLGATEIANFLEPIYRNVELVVPDIRLKVIKRCDGDNRVLECAVKGGCDFIVSGDRRDLLSLKGFEGIRILNPKEFLGQLG